GGVGAGYVWLLMNLVFLFAWVAYVHHKLVPGLHRKWLMKDVLGVCFPGIVIVVVIYLLLPDYDFSSRLASLFYVLLVGVAVISSAAFSTEKIRVIILFFFKNIIYGSRNV